jgi:DNA-binding SARP family transcriptional activator
MLFALFGSLRIECEPADSLPDLPRLREAQGLLAYLLLFRNQAHTRAHLIYLYWGDVPEDRARSSFSVALNAPRPILTPTGAWIAADWYHVRLRLGPAGLDVAEVEAALASGVPRDLYCADKHPCCQ